MSRAYAYTAQPANQRYLRCRATLEARAGRRRLSRPFLAHRGTTLRFPGFSHASMTMRLRACGDRNSWLAGGFRVPIG